MMGEFLKLIKDDLYRTLQARRHLVPGFPKLLTVDKCRRKSSRKISFLKSLRYDKCGISSNMISVKFTANNLYTNCTNLVFSLFQNVYRSSFIVDGANSTLPHCSPTLSNNSSTSINVQIPPPHYLQAHSIQSV